MGTMVQKKVTSGIVSVLVMTPLCTIYFLILDVIFMIYTIISSMILLVTLSKINVGNWMEDQFFRKFLGISRMELIGYRRLRTLSQLLFETFPSILLQLRMLWVLGSKNDANFDISYQSLYWSLVFAFLHTLMEGSILYLDSKACFLSLEEYALVCLNARLSWVPFTNILTRLQIQNKKNCKIDSKYRELDFENIISKFCGLKYKLDFEFGKNSWQILMRHINNISSYCPNITQMRSLRSIATGNNYKQLTNGDIDVTQLLTPLFSQSLCNNGSWADPQTAEMAFSHNNFFDTVPYVTQIKLGKKCCKNLDLFDLYMLFQVSCDKIIIDCGDIDWQRLINMTLIHHKYQYKRISSVLIMIVEYLFKIGDITTVQKCLAAVIATEFDKHIKGINLNSGYSYGNRFDSLKIEILLNARFNTLPLRKCYEHGIMFGVNCKESNVLYSLVYDLIRPVLNGELLNSWENRQRVYTAMTLLWYTQGVIKNHHCYECNKDYIYHIIECESKYNAKMNDRKYGANGNSVNSRKREQIEKLISFYMPHIEIVVNSNSNAIEIPVNGVYSSKLNQLIGHYLFSKAYACSFAVMAVERYNTNKATLDNVDGDSSDSDDDDNLENKILNCNIGTNTCQMILNDNNVNNDNQELEALIVMSKLVDSSALDIFAADIYEDDEMESINIETKTQQVQLDRESHDTDGQIFKVDFSTLIGVRVCLRLYFHMIMCSLLVPISPLPLSLSKICNIIYLCCFDRKKDGI